MTEEIKIKINDFEGPLDLLLHLVGQYKVDIFEVPLVPIIEQYLNFLKAMKTLELEIASEYMVMASQLMLIKSRRLLPTVAEEFIEDTEQLEQDLLAQIDEYRKYKALSQDIAQMHEVRSQHYSKISLRCMRHVASIIPKLKRKLLVKMRYFYKIITVWIYFWPLAMFWLCKNSPSLMKIQP